MVTESGAVELVVVACTAATVFTALWMLTAGEVVVVAVVTGFLSTGVIVGVSIFGRAPRARLAASGWLPNTDGSSES